MEPKYQGYTGKNKGYTASMKALGTSTSSRNKWLKTQEEEEKKKQIEQASNDIIKNATQNPKKEGDGFLEKSKSTLGALGKGVGEALIGSYKRLGEGTAEVINEMTGGAQKERDLQANTQAQDIKTIRELGKKIKSSTDPAEKAKLQTALKNISGVADIQDKAFQERQGEIAERTDPTKGAAAVASVGLDVVTGGALKAATTASKVSKGNKVVNAVNKVTNPNGIKQGVASGAVLGTAYGGIGAVEENGADTTVGDVAKGAAIGGALGGALGGAVGVIGNGLKKLKTAKTPEAVAKATDEIVEEIKTKNESKQLQLGSGMRQAGDIEADIQRIQNGEDDSVVKYTTNEGQDVTSQVADFDKEINARKAAIRDLQQQADGVNLATGEADIPEGVDPSDFTGDVEMRTKAADSVAKLETEIQELTAEQSKAFDALGGVQKSVDPELARERFASLTQEYNAAREYEDGVRAGQMQDAADEIDVKALDAEEQALKSGEVPMEMRKPFERIENVDDAEGLMERIDPTDKNGIVTGSIEVRSQRYKLEDEYSSLFRREEYEVEADAINRDYAEARAAIELLPEPIQAQRIEELDAETVQRYGQIDERLEADAEDVALVEGELEQLDALEAELVRRTNEMRTTDPEAFREVDEDAVNARLSEIANQKFLAREATTSNDAKVVLQEVLQKGESIAEQAEISPAVSKAVDLEVQDAIPNILDNTGKTAGMGWLVGTPTKVLERFGPAGKKIAQVLREAVDQKEMMDGEFHANMETWGQMIHSKDSMERVAKALDGDQDALKAFQGREQEAFDGMRAWFDDFADRLGLPPEGRIKDYLPHLFDGKDLDTVEQTLAVLRAGKKEGKELTQKQITDLENSLTGIDANTLAYLASKNTYQAKNGFLEKRKGAKEYSLDLEKILSAYNNAATTQLSYNPAIREGNELSKALSTEQNRYVSAVFKSLQGETDTVIERAIDGGLKNFSIMTGKNFGGDGTTSRLSKGIRSAIYDATIGANVGSAVRNTQAMVNVYTEVGAKGVAEAAPRALAALRKGSPLREQLYRNGVLSNHQSDYLQGGGMAVMKGKKTKALWGMFNTTESLNRATAFFAGYDKHLAKFPDDIAGAEKAGAVLAKKTNFKFSAIDIPIAMQGDMAKNVLQMQTYNVQQTQFITGLIKDAAFTRTKDGKFTLTGENQMKLYRFLGGNAMFFGTIGAATGMDWKEAVPFSTEIVSVIQGQPQAPRSPLMQVVFGDGKANPGLVETASGAIGATFSGDWADFGKNADALARSAARVLVPGGNQAVKTVEGAHSATTGLSTTGSGITDTIGKAFGSSGGNIRFTQGQDAWSRIKATVLGQYATESGRDWVDEGMVNVPTSLEINGMPASDYIKQLPRASQEQYVTYFTTKSAAQKELEKTMGPKSVIKSEISEGLRTGKLTETDAVKQATAYNQAAIESISRYLQGNKNIPPRILEDIKKNVLINVQSSINSSKRTKSLEAMAEELEFAQSDFDEDEYAQ